MQGSLHVTIPYTARSSGAGRLTIEILDPENRSLAHIQKRLVLAAGNASWRDELKLTPSLPLEDLVWHRLRYRFTYDNPRLASIEGVESISQILRSPVLRVLGQQTYLAGGPAAVRVIVTDSAGQPIAGPAALRIQLADPGRGPQVLFTGPLNLRGTAEAQFSFPAGLTGPHSLSYRVDTTIGSAETVQPVKLEDTSQILLTTEKPLYQPGQTIHVRALALDRATHQASANRPLTFEVQDSRGNKVFKKSAQTDEFGVASAEFALADEVNLGKYQLRAAIDGSSPTTANITLDVERYVLPKFKVELEFTGQAQHGYRPGDHVTGVVRANYFFGKPVDNAEVTVKASAMDVAAFNAASLHGSTDAEGVWNFDFQLPDYFAGRPLTQGVARVLVEATVKDGAAHSETRSEPITVSQSPILITAVPEGGTLIPNLPNDVFILTSYPDGQPAVATIRLLASNVNQDYTTDASGVAVVSVVANGPPPIVLALEARDSSGNQARTDLSLATRGGNDQVLLRTERAVYRAGDSIRLQVLSTHQTGAVYLDIAKDSQTILTRDLDLAGGQASLTLAATPDLAGTIDCHAYVIGANAQPVSDHRLVFVQPADELKIEAAADAPVYKPGDDARIRFRVTNSRGEGVRAALGVQMVDQAVFSLADQQPGFAKLFFYLEQEVMKPRYEIHSIGMPQLLTTAGGSRDLAGRALFAAAEMVSGDKFDREVGRTVPQDKLQAYLARYRSAFQSQAGALARRLSAVYDSGDLSVAMDRLTSAGDPLTKDPWGRNLLLQSAAWSSQGGIYRLWSAGPDKRFSTADDMDTYFQTNPRTDLSLTGSLEITTENLNPRAGLAEVLGAVLDYYGQAVGGAAVRVESIFTGHAISTRTNSDGQFRLSRVLPGAYRVRVTAAGLRPITREFNLRGGDRAVLSATFALSGSRDSVTLAGVGFGSGGGIGHGMGGGIGGGDYFARGFAAGPGGGGVARVLFGNPLAALQASDNGAFMINGATSAGLDTEVLDVLGAGGNSAPHVRTWFPESLYNNPEIITDKSGEASISIPLADSITTWRMSMVASTTRGALGSAASGIKVFQDFFADLDLPVTLTQGDRVSIPVAIYNYSGSAGDVKLRLKSEDWYSLVSDVAEKSVAVESGRVGGSQFTLEARRIGKFKLTLAARMSGAANRSDILVREIEVVPNGREQSIVYNGRLENSVEHPMDFPADAIPDASKLFIRLYPSPMSQVIEGIDSILRMPGGCFEQTSSSTYPNVLALDYMKHSGKLTPEIRAKAEHYIANGYQRLLTFEVPGGGFSWFGAAPANKILTAYGLMEFSDMSKVYDVDARVIQRTQQWLASQQQPDGSWKPDTQFINEGATNRYNSGDLRITAYIAWSLQNTGYRGPAVEKARQYIEQHMASGIDAYTLAVLANFAADYAQNHALTNRAVDLLMAAASTGGEQISWTAEETGMYGRGASAAVETTGLAVQALLKSGAQSIAASQALAFLAAHKDATGAWATTQATIMALRAILLSTEKGAADVRGDVEISLNGKPVQTLHLTPENNDLLHQFVIPSARLATSNSVTLRFSGNSTLAYQVAGTYFLPWDIHPAAEPLSIDVAYDRTQLAQNDIAAATATIRNNLPKTANMVMVDLGIPPGFDLLTEDLQAYQQQSAAGASGRLQKFNLTATQAILYFDSFAPGDTVKLKFRLRAKYPIRAQTFPSKVYEYYDPEVNALAPPVRFEVRQ